MIDVKKQNQKGEIELDIKQIIHNKIVPSGKEYISNK